MKDLTKWAVVEKGPLTASGQDEILLTARTQNGARQAAQALNYINNHRNGDIRYDLVRLPGTTPLPELSDPFEGVEFEVIARTRIGLRSQHKKHGYVVRIVSERLGEGAEEALPKIVERAAREMVKEAVLGLWPKQ